MISATRMLCQKYTDLTDAEISYLESYGALLPALANAEQRYTLNDRERNVIRSHMWPLTLLTPPRCREAAVVCVADKMSSATETLFERQRMIPAAQTSGRN